MWEWLAEAALDKLKTPGAVETVEQMIESMADKKLRDPLRYRLKSYQKRMKKAEKQPAAG